MNLLNLVLVVEIVVTSREAIAEQFTYRPSSHDEDYKHCALLWRSLARIVPSTPMVASFWSRNGLNSYGATLPLRLIDRCISARLHQYQTVFAIVVSLWLIGSHYSYGCTAKIGETLRKICRYEKFFVSLGNKRGKAIVRHINFIHRLVWNDALDDAVPDCVATILWKGYQDP